MTDFICEPLGGEHDRTQFDCGEPALNAWFKERARQDQKRRVAAVYVLAPREEPTRVAGFYSLSATSLLLSSLPQAFIKRLPRYPVVPAYLIGRLARDREFPGVGELLMFDALQRALRHSAEIAAPFVVVDSKNDRAEAFYRRFGFEPIPATKGRLILPMETIEKT